MLETEKLSSTEEKRIIVGMIVSTDFCKKIIPLHKPDYFLNSYLKTLAIWCENFFLEFKTCPYKHIADIYDAEAPALKETDSEMIGTLLENLDDLYDENSFNVEYFVEGAKEYYRKRELEIVVNNVSILKEKGDFEGAEQQISEFKRVTTAIDYSVIVDMSNIEQMEAIYEKKDREEREFFKLPGDLGRYLGNHKRGDVVGFYAPSKRGKSFTLIDYFKQGVLSKRKTLLWSIEMTDTEVVSRTQKAFEPMTDGDDGYYEYPVFDCIQNQTGECSKRRSGAVIVEDGEVIPDPQHKTCTKCMRSRKKRVRKKYKMAIYRKSKKRVRDDIFAMRKNYERFQHMWKKYARISVHPKYTLTEDKMMTDLEALLAYENWFPDIILIDYIDILGMDSKFDDFRLEDERWKMLARLAGKTNTLVMTVTQANKAGHTAENLDSTMQGGFYGKNRHVNLMCGLNQTPEEKERGIMRFGITEARSQPYIQGKDCIVLQDFGIGQANLNSYYP